MALTEKQVSMVKAMLIRGDKQHNIAAYFNVNSGRIAEIATGKRYPHVDIYTGPNLPSTTPKEPQPRNKKTFVRSDASVIEEAMPYFDSQSDLADAIGVSGPSIGTWRRTNDMPMVARLAIEKVLEERAGKSGADRLFFLRVPADQRQSIEAVFSLIHGIKAIDLGEV